MNIDSQLLNRYFEGDQKEGDKEKIATALETQSEKNVEPYKRYDYEIIAETTIPDSNMPHFLMVRHPKK